MALTKQQKETLDILCAKGGMSNRAIAREVGCSEKTVRKHIDSMDMEKSALSALADEEIDNIIMRKEIDRKKSALNPHVKSAYDELLLTRMQAENLQTNLNTSIMAKLLAMLEEGTKETKINAGDGVQQIEPIKYDPSDVLALAKAAQTASDSLGITQRGPHSAVQVNNNTSSGIDVKRYEITEDEGDG